jgi:aspartate/methionine/tyrosine aminotransferase
LTASTSEAYSFLFKLLCDPEDEVLAPRPSYPLFEFLAALEAVRIGSYPLVYDGGWFVDIDAIRHAITAKTRAIIVVNPNNPTGSFLKRHELDQLTQVCIERDIAIISDEVFSDYTFGEDPARVSSLTEAEGVLAFSLSGLSKVAALPQMKLGWIVVSGPERGRREAFNRLELIADTYLSVGAPVQWAAAALLQVRASMQPQILSRVQENCRFLDSQIGPGSAWKLLRAEGGWYAILQAPRIRSEEDWVLGLVKERDVLVQPGYFFDFDQEAFLVASLLTPCEAFREGVQRILRF